MSINPLPSAAKAWASDGATKVFAQNPPTAPKMRVLADDSKVALTIDRREWLYRALLIRGTAHTETVDGEHALRLVGDEVGKMIKDECYPQVYRTVHEARKQTQGFIYDFGFHSLLGAMYLQMMLLITDANNIRQCHRPGCPRILPSSARKDKVFCGRAACKQWWSDNYGNCKKARAARKRRQS